MAEAVASLYFPAMTIELYDLTVPAFTRGLQATAAFLEKGRTFAEAEGLDPATLIQARLFDDMGNLASQVQRMSDSAKLAVIRLAQLDPVPMADTETSFAELQDRIARTLAVLEGVTPEQINGRETAEVLLKTARGETLFTGRDYVLGFALPNFYFHVTTAYDILRHKGVPLGKRDYLGSALR
jgi:uncharacterized protein